MRRPALALAATPLLALAACGGAEAGAEEHASPVPDGVVEQYGTLDDEVTERGGRTTAGDWTVSYIVEAAEPWFEGHGQHERFREPASGETHHIEIIPTETSTGRIVPDVPVNVQVVDEKGAVVDEQRLNFYYSAFFQLHAARHAGCAHLPAARRGVRAAGADGGGDREVRGRRADPRGVTPHGRAVRVGGVSAAVP